jgi:(1->4)-alpha-D-glucan 1-alpha-D-glucosylmutase
LAELRATYRVQLHAGFTFDDAAAIVPYLAELGVSHLYCSPYLQAAPGSMHGYDVVDHHRLNDELGGEAGYERLSATLREHGMGHIVDIVPNHMAIAGRANAWWWDVLEDGPSSMYATYFDIDWDPPERRLTTKVLVPILGDHYGRVLEAGELNVVRDGGSFTVRYFDNDVPVSPRTIDELLARAAERTGNDELASLANAFGRLPHALVTDRASVIERHRDKEVLRARLESLLDDEAACAVAVDEEVKALNEEADALDVLLQRQNYRLAYWRTAGRELDYRRFFDITTLVALRVEDPVVFDDTHELILELVQRGDVEGLRVDHVDGLLDPEGYLERLRTRARARGTRPSPSATASGGADLDTAIVIEKILERDETLPVSWPVEGTTGYDFLAQVDGLFVDPSAEASMSATYARFTGESAPFEEVALAAKHEVMRSVLAADIERLTELFVGVAENHRRHRDYTRTELREALRETIAAFDVYRTYVRVGRTPSAEDVARVEHSTSLASTRRPDLEPELFRFLRDVLLLREGDGIEAELAQRFQQVTSPVMAKSVEDTAFYRYNRLVSLNEVGGDPASFGRDIASFHARRAEDMRLHPRGLLASSTHDTKRGEDVRARLAVLSELPDAWEAAVWEWAHHNEQHRIDGLPDRNAEYLLYQTLVGAWPLSVDRAAEYMEKAAKEAKVHTSWVDPVPAYDEALRSFVERALEDDVFVASLESFLREHDIVARGERNSFVQTALKLTSPGTPDIYQGSELWNLSLVDPDNRRPVDYEARQRMLEALAGTESGLLPAASRKLGLIHRLLLLRRERRELFEGYESLAVSGPDGDRLIAFERHGLVVVAERFPARGLLAPGTSVALPPGDWEDVLAGGAWAGDWSRLDDFPVVVLAAP